MKFSCSMLLLCLLVLSEAQDLRRTYASWKAKYSKKGSDGLRSEMERFRIFQRSAAQIAEINASQDEWGADFTIFADMTEGERQGWLGIPANQSDPEARSDMPVLGAPTTAEVNLGAFAVQKHWEVTKPRNQGSCGSCWAFAAVGALEGQHLKHHGEYREFSEQSILDCTFERYATKDGCKGGWTTSAIDWVKSSAVSGTSFHGYLPTRQDNQYEGEDQVCRDATRPYPNALKRGKPSYRTAQPSERTNAGLLKNIALSGPLSVYIWSSWQLQFYQVGLYGGTGCGGIAPRDMNHAVTATGYGVDYFLLKNSWGTMWGRSGYGYFSRKTESLCNVAAWQTIINWHPNTAWNVCRDTHHTERTECRQKLRNGEFRSLTEKECGQMGCCYDQYARDAASKCFAKGKLTVWDAAGNRRVLYGATPDFGDLAFSSSAVSAQAEYGRWVLYDDDDYSGTSRSLQAKDGKVRLNVESAYILP